MTALKIIFSGKSLRALLVMAGVAGGVLLFCMGLQIPYLPQGSDITVFAGQSLGLSIAALSLVLILLLPPLMHMVRTGRTSLGAYAKAVTLWMAGFSILAGIGGGFINHTDAGKATLATSLLVFPVLAVPSLMVVTGYWFMAIRPEDKGREAVLPLCALFVGWCVLAFFIAIGISTAITAPVTTH